MDFIYINAMQNVIVIDMNKLNQGTYIVTRDGHRGYVIKQTEPHYYIIRWSGGTVTLHESCLTIDTIMEEAK